MVDLEAREASQLSRLAQLSASANKNRDFQNLFQNTLSVQIADRQKIQGQRLSELQEKVAALNALKEQVATLKGDAAALEAALQNSIYPARKQIMYDISDLQNADIERMNKIEEAQTRANAINERIDNLFEKAWGNTRDLNSIKLATRKAIISLNSQQSTETSLVLDPNGDNPSQNVNFPFNGTPQFSQVVLTGFDLIRTFSGYNSGGYPTLYVGVDNLLMTNMAQIDAVDLSSGGWSVNNVTVGADFVFFDTQQFSLKN
ncbi:uncharacterized protein LOC118477687 [Aplysia californica]|uniref:Uncharacterized protein LOC118477687 n=1 Tax=Aplysia californica TaxID=6500 RepID=A0ABM1VTA8_APLCA|nr:uncharacterized protein LOC118477687 [Aplysia californica]